MKEQFVALRIENITPASGPTSKSISRKWKQLTTCQKRVLIIVIFLLCTGYFVGTQLHELHRKAKHHKNKSGKNHKNSSDDSSKDYEVSDFEPVPDREDDQTPIEEDFDPELRSDYIYNAHNHPELDEPDNSKSDEYSHQEKTDDSISDSSVSWRGNGIENEKMKSVKEAFLHAWKGYSTYAFGHDMLKPISRRYEDWFSVGDDLMGLTLIDSLDVMVIMGLDKEFNHARKWVEEKLSLAPNNARVNLFECTIRVLGGFLSTYYLTNDELFKQKAIEIGDRLMPAIEKSKTNVPFSDVNLKSLSAQQPAWGSQSSTSEVTTIQMEFGQLSYLTGNEKYENAVYKVSKHISELKTGKMDGLVPLWIDPISGSFQGKSSQTYTMGARTDSYYEYLFKRWYQDKSEKYGFMVEDFRTAMDGVQKHLFGYTQPNHYLLVGERIGNRFSPKMDHLVCFLPGTLALAVHSKQLPPVWLEYAEQIAETCHQFYMTETGLAPEISYFNLDKSDRPDLDIHTADRFSILRPETVESYFYLWRITKKQKYRDWGWTFFQNLELHAKVEHGYSSISNVQSASRPQPRDKMESFFLGETLKYLYLLFADDDLLPLENWVFNTEAHPFPVHR